MAARFPPVILHLARSTTPGYHIEMHPLTAAPPSRGRPRSPAPHEAALAATFDDLDCPGHPHADEDFRIQIERLAAVLPTPAGRACAALIDAAAGDPAIAPVIAVRWVAARRHWRPARLEPAPAAGQVLPGVDPEAALPAFDAPLHARLRLGLGVPGDAEIDAGLGIACRGVFAAEVQPRAAAPKSTP